nr:DUF3971 domain-containing protein [Saccharibacter sp. 17.LH.SD]
MQDSQQKLVPVNITTQFHTDSLLALQHIGIDVHAEIPAFDFASLGSIWPQGVMKGGRRWITSNMPVGKGENLTLSAHLQSDHGLKELAVTHLEGDLRGHGLDVFWLRPVQPITGLEAHAHFLDADRLQIDVSHGQIKGDQGVLIRVPQGTTIISGLMHKDQFAHIHVGLNGTLPSFLKLLAHPRLHLLSRHPVPLMKPSGMVLGELSLSLPLDSRVTVNDISFAAKAQCSQIAFGLPALGAIRQGNGLLHVTSKEMHFQGQASLRNVPVQLSMMESFQANVEGRLLRQVDAHALLGPTTWPAFGINIPKGMLMGPVLTNVAYRQVGLGPGHRKADVDLMLDFTQAAVLLPVWSKLSGDSASLTGHIVLLDGALQQLDNVKAKGPGLFLSGTAEIQRHRVHGMVFDHMHVGRNEGRLQIEWPNSLTAHDPYRIDVNALTLDLAPWLKKTSNKKRSGSEVGNKKKSSSWRLPSGKWQVSVQADHVFFDSETAFERVRMAAVWQQYKIQRANLSIVAPYPVTMQLEPRVNGQHLDVSVQNIGDFLKTIGVYSVLSGGSARITGTFLPERLSQQTVGWGIGLGSFEGHLEAQDVAIPHPPAVLTMATVFAPLHWGQLTRDRFEGLSLSSDIMLADEILTLKQTQTHNAMVGGTIEGTVNFKTDALEMKGTVSPFFGLNRAAGSLFGVSSKGKGAMAMNYTLKGTLDHPEFHTYPLSAFLPDVLSNIFH